jgi:hypothetical protein
LSVVLTCLACAVAGVFLACRCPCPASFGSKRSSKQPSDAPAASDPESPHKRVIDEPQDDDPPEDDTPATLTPKMAAGVINRALTDRPTAPVAPAAPASAGWGGSRRWVPMRARHEGQH